MTGPTQYRKRPIVIEAVQWTGDNLEAIWDWAGAENVYGPTEENPDALIISTSEGRMRADLGDWVIRGVAGELYPCKDPIFRETYEPVEADPS